jgi:hypothetical protein
MNITDPTIREEIVNSLTVQEIYECLHRQIKKYNEKFPEVEILNTYIASEPPQNECYNIYGILKGIPNQPSLTAYGKTFEETEEKFRIKINNTKATLHAKVKSLQAKANNLQTTADNLRAEANKLHAALNTDTTTTKTKQPMHHKTEPNPQLDKTLFEDEWEDDVINEHLEHTDWHDNPTYDPNNDWIDDWADNLTDDWINEHLEHTDW